MLTLLDRYIGKQVLIFVVITLFSLVVIRTLFTLLDETGNLGKGSYQFIDMLYYTILLIPSRTYEFFPMGVLIGGLTALGLLASHNELTVMRAAGIRTSRILLSAIKSTIILILAVLIIGELIAPLTSKEAQQTRASALSGGSLTQSKSGVWARSGTDVLHIRRILNNQQFADVSLFMMDKDARLVRVIQSQTVLFSNGFWLFKQAKIQTPQDEKVETVIDDYSWKGDVNPQHIEVLTVEPEMLNIAGLSEYKAYLQRNDLEYSRYELAFWRKIAQPLSLIVMIMLAGSFVFGPMRSVSMGARLMTGIITGFGFYLVNQFFGPISLVYQLPPILGAMIPLVIFTGVAYVLLKRAK